MASLQSHYEDHAAEARRHEAQREVMTNIALPVAALLIGLVTFVGMSIWALPAAIAVAALGAYGLLFSAKHYERFKYHTAIAKALDEEMERLAKTPDSAAKSLHELKALAERDHYLRFVWPHLRGTRSKPQAMAPAWIARQRLHMFWEAAHVGVAVLGLLLCLMILIKAALPEPRPTGSVPVSSVGAS